MPFASNPELSTLASTVQLFPDLVSQLSSASNVTILAPNNDAFTELFAAGTVQPNDTSLIQAVLSYHVLDGVYRSTDIYETPSFVPTLLTDELYTNVTGGQVVEALSVDGSVFFISGLRENSTVTTADITFTSGVIHIIDSVLTLPRTLSATAAAFNLTAVADALTQVGLVEVADSVADITVFAPTNEAFDAIAPTVAGLTTEQLTNILLYHVGTQVAYSPILSTLSSLTTLAGADVTITVRDGELFVDDARVVVADVLIYNGVVHVIDSLLNPDGSTATSTPTGTPSPTTGAPPVATFTGMAMPMKTGAVVQAALFGAGVAVMNL
ncbi:hypothetical protein LTR70_010287 [Exophiala xenobiotica]|uniref:FAS1 domain-containing protein n=1 Tax=Lithohypha guttulata TaxID=1690604 RepID=A0ABR0JWF9_9EURO|nr:hypothetical protein LTR24_009633 [Lithohypha guttulata]KAK5309437.1 hypothetical protein LTR70_010287 [Exophiala xenobiotica]